MNENRLRSSYWETTSFLRPADVGIVGGGLTGLQTALEIKKQEPDLDVVVIERAAFSRGASTRNAGFACFGSPTELLEDLVGGDATKVWDTVARRYAGIRRLQEAYGPHVDYAQHGGYELFFDRETHQTVLEALPSLNEGFRRITGQDAVWSSTPSVSGIKKDCFLVHNALEGQLHPGKLVEKLVGDCQSHGIRLLFGLNVSGVGRDQGNYFIQPEGQETPICCRQLVVATNAFARNLLPELPVTPARNQVLISEPIPELKLRGCYHHERGYVYLRNVGADRVLIGGARHLAGERAFTTRFGDHPRIEKELMAILDRTLELPRGQKIEVAGSWSGIIAQGGKAPIVQRNADGIVVAARLAGMGVALSARLAEEAAALALS